MIEVKNLSKAYGGFHAVKNVSFTVPTGQACGFLGPNGAGKTTTMRIITGYMPATSGSVEVEGFDVVTASTGRAGFPLVDPALAASYGRAASEFVARQWRADRVAERFVRIMQGTAEPSWVALMV